MQPVQPVQTLGQTYDLRATALCEPAQFLTPLDVEFLLPPTDFRHPQFCQPSPSQTPFPSVLNGGRVFGGGIPMVEPAFQANLPNVRVSLLIQDIANVVVSGSGVDTIADNGAGEVFVDWSTTGLPADEENGGPYGWGLPDPGETWENLSHPGGGGGLLVYDALVFGACGGPLSFHIAHTASIEDNGLVIGQFDGSDNSTLDETGFYNVNYTARADDGMGNVSDFVFSGKVNVTCSGLLSLP
jgi:hypothetical protein